MKCENCNLNKKRIESLKNTVSTQSIEGNCDYDRYMHGMANGLILAQSIITDTKPEFLRASGTWRKNISENHEPQTLIETTETNELKMWKCNKCNKETERLQINWAISCGEKVDVLDWYCPHCQSNELTFQGTKE